MMAQQIQTGSRRNSCQPAFKGAAPLEIAEPRISSQKYLLRRLFDLAALPEKPGGDAENSWRITSDDLFKSRLIPVAREARQVKIGCLCQDFLQVDFLSRKKVSGFS